MSETSTRWGLVLDESGNFDEPDADPVVAGLLIREARPELGPFAIRETLRAAAPEVPWPIHATWLRRPVMFALWTHLSDYRYGSRRLHDAAREAVACLYAGRADTLESVLDALAAGTEPVWDEAKVLDDLLRASHRRVFERLRGRSRQVIERVRDGLRSLTTLESPSPIILIAAAEGRRGDALPAAPGEDRYLTLLTILLERVAHLLGEAGGAHEVRIHALERHVEEPAVGRRTRLHVRHLDAAAREATRSDEKFWQGRSGRVRLIAASTPTFDSAVDARLVLADFVANALGRVLPSDVTLTTLDHNVRQTLSLSLLAPETSLPGAAASGRARVFVHGALDRGAVPDRATLTRVRQWAGEQALAWAQVFAAPAADPEA